MKKKANISGVLPGEPIAGAEMKLLNAIPMLRREIEGCVIFYKRLGGAIYVLAVETVRPEWPEQGA